MPAVRKALAARAKINWANPLTRGLIFAYLPGEPANLVNPKDRASFSGQVVRKDGSLLLSGGAQNGLSVGNGPLLGPLSNSTVIGIGTFTAGYRCIYAERGTGNEIFKLETGYNATQGVQLTYRNAYNTLDFCSAQLPMIGDGRRVFAAVITGSKHEVWTGLVGRPSASTEAYATTNYGSSNTFNNSAVIRTHGFDPFDSDQPLSGTSDILLGWSRSLSIAEIQQLRADPDQIIVYPIDRDSELLLRSTRAVPADTSLAGAGTLLASSSGVLSTGIALAGGAVQQAIGAGTLTTSIQLVGAAQQRTTSAGNLSTSIPLTGTALLRAAATGDLSGGTAALAGQAGMRITAVGELATSILLGGAAQSRAFASGTLAAPGAGLAGTAQVATSSAGLLMTGIRLAGAATAQVSGIAALKTEIVLGGTAAARVSSAATLLTSISLGGTVNIMVGAGGKLADGPGPLIDISKISPSRISVFDGSGSRVSVFDGSGSRVAVFEGSGSRVTRFQ